MGMDDTEQLLETLPARIRDRIEVTEDGCWLSPVPVGSWIVMIDGRATTVRQHLQRLAGVPREAHSSTPSCPNNRCVRPDHMEPKWRCQRGGTKGRQYAAVRGKARDMAVRVLQERGFVEMADKKRHVLKIGEYRVWAGEEGLTWVEPPTFYSAVRAGKADSYELMTGRNR